jgi:DNA primase
MSLNKRYNCPFCPALGYRNDDLAFSVSWIKGKYHCFRCGTSGGVDSLPPNFKKPLILKGDKKPHEQLDMGNMISLEDSPGAQRYFIKRGLSPEPLLNHVFVSGDRKKLIFPFYDAEGNIIYYVIRKMWGSGLRYTNMTAAVGDIYIPPGTILPCRLKLIVTEGIFDALSVWQWLGIESIGLLGMNINAFKIRRILESTYPETEIIILLDAGEYQTARAYYDEIRPLRKHTKICHLNEGDPNEVGKEYLWKKLMPSALSVVEKTSLSTN